MPRLFISQLRHRSTISWRSSPAPSRSRAGASRLTGPHARECLSSSVNSQHPGSAHALPSPCTAIPSGCFTILHFHTSSNVHRAYTQHLEIGQNLWKAFGERTNPSSTARARWKHCTRALYMCTHSFHSDHRTLRDSNTVEVLIMVGIPRNPLASYNSTGTMNSSCYLVLVRGRW